ncbi:hypothetical protein [Aggregatilinea lenta]|uniref:hypothetical protein n=1 Tax=Aggregatilinea lenta TaxID=913108 RepID=UPI0013C2A272|nr:hypothetical protein [Aggregatilinea lenta]
MSETKQHPCETCKLRASAEENPKTWKARLWRFHTKFCPGWKSYQRSLAQPK